MPSLGHALNECGSIKLAVATVVKNPAWRKKEINGIMYYAIPEPPGGDSELMITPGKKLLKDCLNATEDFSPDIVHIHGTEYFYGFLSARRLIKYPAVISVQGIIGECEKVYYGGLSFGELLRCQEIYDFFLARGIFFERIAWHKRSRAEKEIIRGNRYFIGRTAWDKKCALRINPEAVYYHCEELLRVPFYLKKWDYSQAVRHSIFTAISYFYPLKGFHWLLRALVLLKKDFNDVSLRVAGPFTIHPRARNYVAYLRELISLLGLSDSVVLLGELDAKGVVNELERANAFAISSMIENGSNALSEAMLVGTPCVAPLVGGITTTINDRSNALGFSPGDPVMLAKCLKSILKDEVLAKGLSESARKTALGRHNEEGIIKTMLGIYEDVIKRAS